ncbi:alpha/beta hydrolase [Paraburkholderia dipogonis]|uniref:Alpha/beta hydrolase n=1 Tax=Paraburkholderia dipogonis TaxID=1211383 RepID=A0A4Y8MGC4_9BURK|nr:alpha/beta hydrolase [Paraburkholderia dipogonis]TFE36511.1 alpha/beta hydrolase [Paraburkholderia dipogonis]
MSVYALEAIEDEFCDVSTGMRICYRTYGQRSGEPLLLVAGLGLQLTFWPPSLINGFVERGYRVVIFDNRDVGRSSRATQPAPGLLRQFLRRCSASAYTLQDMAKDAIGLLDHLCMSRAHVVGMSMGGMIAQTIAARYPQRTLSLTSIFSTTGARRVGQPALSSMLMLAKPPPRSREEVMQRHLKLISHIGSTTYPVNKQALRAYAAGAWDRGHGAHAHEGTARQIGAIIKSGDRTAEVRRIEAPTLIVHGDQDRMVAPSGGIATAAAIAGAEMITIRGMGHFIPEAVVPILSDLIDGHARRSSLALMHSL